MQAMHYIYNTIHLEQIPSKTHKLEVSTGVGYFWPSRPQWKIILTIFLIHKVKNACMRTNHGLARGQIKTGEASIYINWV